jgi:hypothetical protein
MSAPTTTQPTQAAKAFLLDIGVSQKLLSELTNPHSPIRYVARELGLNGQQVAALRQLLGIGNSELSPETTGWLILRRIYQLGLRSSVYEGRFAGIDIDTPLVDVPSTVQRYYIAGTISGEPHFTHCSLLPATELAIVLGLFGLKSCGSNVLTYPYLSTPVGDQLCLVGCSGHLE